MTFCNYWWPSLNIDDFCINIDDFCVNIDDLFVNIDDFCVKIFDFCINIDYFCVSIDDLFVNIDNFCVKLFEFCKYWCFSVNIDDFLWLQKIFAFHDVVSVPRKSFKFFLPRSWLVKIRHTDIPRKTLIRHYFSRSARRLYFHFIYLFSFLFAGLSVKISTVITGRWRRWPQDFTVLYHCCYFSPHSISKPQLDPYGSETLLAWRTFINRNSILWTRTKYFSSFISFSCFSLSLALLFGLV